MVTANSLYDDKSVPALELINFDHAQCTSKYYDTTSLIIYILFATIAILQLQIFLLKRRLNRMSCAIQDNSTQIWWTAHKMRYLASIIADILGLVPVSKILSISNT